MKRLVCAIAAVIVLIGSSAAYNGDVTVYVTDTGECYHRAGCSYLHSRIEVTLKEAVEQGYRSCSQCNPPKLEDAPEEEAEDVSHGSFRVIDRKTGETVSTIDPTSDLAAIRSALEQREARKQEEMRKVEPVHMDEDFVKEVSFLDPVIAFVIVCIIVFVFLKILTKVVRAKSTLDAIDRLKKGERVELSLAQIANANINLPDAKKNLSADKFEQLYALYRIYQKHNDMILCTPEEYAIIAAKIVVSFDKIDSFLKYSGEENLADAQIRLAAAYSLHNEEPESVVARDFFRFFDC